MVLPARGAYNLSVLSMHKPAVAVENVSAHVARVLHRSQDLALQSEFLQWRSRRLLQRSISLVVEVETLKSQAQDSIVHGFVVAREGRRLHKQLRCPYARPTDGTQKVVSLALFRRRSSAA